MTVVVTSLERVVETVDKPTVVVTGMIGPKGTTYLNENQDVDVTNLVNGATLVYSDSIQKWQATNLLENQIMNGGFF